MIDASRLPLESAACISGRTRRFYTLHLSSSGAIVVERTKAFFEKSQGVTMPPTQRVMGSFSEVSHGLPDQVRADFSGALKDMDALSLRPRVT